MEKYGVEYEGVDEPAPADAGERDAAGAGQLRDRAERAARATRADVTG